ncbi:MAG: cell wall-active antibiotics response protein [Bacteroidales bacterium]|nr:cell wall-active antibiotics response protein [Bacteroidales bacterium]
MNTIRSNRRTILGIMLIVFGLLWAASTIWPGAINLMFDGWWTLFIIVPCLCGLFSRNDRTSSAFGLTVGVLLLLEQQEAISWHHFGHLMLAALVVYLGFKLIVRNNPTRSSRQAKTEARQILRDGRNVRTYEVSFGEQHAKLDNETFEGADIECSFGAFRLDLSHAIIRQDVVVSIECSFGGTTIIVPQHCGVKVAAKSAFGGIEDKRSLIPQAPEHTIFINGNVSFAGVEIKNEV